MYKLELLVPQYSENEAIVKPLLDSIAGQQNKELLAQIHVIICNDGSNTRLSRKFLDKFPFKISYFLEEHGGISATRNKLLDRASADYIMFCDADDMFLRPDAFDIIFRNIKEKQFDFMLSHFVEEVVHPATGQPAYLVRTKGLTFVHGKVYRLGFLRAAQIRWNNRLTIHEDSYFNFTCHAVSRNTYLEETPFYLWKYRPDSIARRDPLFHLTSYNNLLDSESALLHEYIRRGLQAHLTYQITFILIKGYYITTSDDWQKWDDTFAKATALSKLRYLYRKFRLCYLNRDSGVEKLTWKNVKEDLEKSFSLNEDQEPFYAWLQRLTKG